MLTFIALPRWPFKNSSLESPSSVPSIPIYETTPTSSGASDFNIETILEDFENAFSINDFYGLISKHNLDFRNNHLLSRMIFGLMLSRSGHDQSLFSIDDCHAFLSDPSLNPHGTKNYFSLINYLVRHPTSQDALERHFHFIRDSIQLGVISTHEIAAIIRLIPHIQFDAKTQEEILGYLSTCYHAVFDGLEACPVLSLSDFQQSSLASWLPALVCAKPTMTVLSVCKDILSIVKYSDIDLSGLPSVVSGALVSIRPGGFAELSCYLTHVQSILSSLPQELSMRLIVTATENIVFSQNSEDFRAELLLSWAWVLARLGSDILLLPVASWKNVASGFSFSPSSEINYEESLLLRLWVCVAIDAAAPAAIRHSHRKRIFKALLSLLDRVTRKPRHADILIKLPCLLQSLGLRDSPFANTLLETAARVEFTKAKRKFLSVKHDVSYLLKENAEAPISELDPAKSVKSFVDFQERLMEEYEQRLRSSSLYSVLQTSLSAPASLDSILHNYSFHCRSRRSLLSAFRHLASITDVTSAAFIEEMVIYALSGPVTRSIIFHLLSHHTPMKLALPHAPKLRRTSSLSTSSSSLAPKPTPESYLDMLHTLAIVLACHPHLPPTTAWRLVHRIHRFILRHHGPTRPVMTHALFHTGTQRCIDACVHVPAPRWAFVARIIKGVTKGKVTAEMWLDGRLMARIAEFRSRSRSHEEPNRIDQGIELCGKG